MITVNQEHDFCITIKGHANKDVKGKDIVCAAASVLALTLADMVEDASRNQMLASPPVIEISKGYTEIECVPNEKYTKQVADAFKFAMCGYTLLAQHYPKFVKLT